MTLPRCKALFLLFLATLTFAASTPNKTDVTFATHNLHGFSKSSKYLKDCINSYGGIWFIQEHWLSDSKLQQLQQLDTQFVARSGMEDAVSSGVYRGRPFGGVAICWRPELSHLISPITNFKHKRVVAVEFNAGDDNFLLISIYMPFHNSSRREHCMTETIDAISMIELIIDAYPQHQVIIGGDLNTELKGDSPFDALWLDLMTKNRFAYCDQYVQSPGYTYRHDSLNQTKFNDHFIVSHALLERGILHDHIILDEGENTSDHLPLLMKVSLQLEESSFTSNSESPTRNINWKKISVSDKASYSSSLEQLLLSRSTPLGVSSCHQICGCRSQSCIDDIEREYKEIRTSLVSAAVSLPRIRPGVEKDWWTPELTLLRDQSVAIHQLWLSEGRPRQGPTYQERLRVRAAYKCAIRLAKKSPKQKAWNRLHTAMEAQDNDSFWKWWKSIYNKNKTPLPPVVDGQSSKAGIASAFQRSFEANCNPNNVTKVEELNSRFTDKYQEYSTNHTQCCDCDQHIISLDTTIDAVFSMKQGKSSDDDGIQSEHFQNAPLILFIKLTSLFNFMLAHSYVPSHFRFGTIIPIIKDKRGNAGDVNNYRGITISAMTSKVFEHVLKSEFSQHLNTSSYQFGCKSNNSTAHALFTLKETINYFIDHGSRVYCSFLDASKAFDRLVHSGLFLKLIERGTPKRFLDILIHWYNDLQCRVKWDGHHGEWFSISAGVRQGGVLSPDFYNIYVDGLVSILQSSGFGCHVRNIFVGALLYADDVCILSPSLRGLQRMLDICNSYCVDWDICLNPKKTKNMFFGKPAEIKFRPTLNNSPIDFITEWKYLGVVLRSGKRFGCAVSERVKSFYRCLNSILRVEGRSDDMVLLRLIEAHCVPLLSYAIEMTDVADRNERRSLRVAYNSIFRKIFGYRQFESVTNLQHALGRQTWEELIDKRKSGFATRARRCGEDTLVRLFCK